MVIVITPPDWRVRAITIFDIHGRGVYSQLGNEPFSVSELTDGNYIVRIDTYNNDRSTHRLIVSR